MSLSDFRGVAQLDFPKSLAEDEYLKWGNMTKDVNRIEKLTRANPLVIVALKFLVTVLILVILFSYVGFHETLEKLARLGVVDALIILGLLMLQQVIAAFRWQRILVQIGENHGFLKIAEIFLSGAIANFVLINTLGGLSVRVLLLKKAGTGIKKAIYSLGLATLYTVSSLVVCFVIGMAVYINLGGAMPAQDYRIVLLLAAGCLAAIAVAWILVKQLPLESISELADMARKTIAAPKLLATGLSLSFLILGIGFVALTIIAMGLEVKVSLILFLALQPAIALMAMLPLSLGGWGVREVSMVVGLGLLGVEASDALAISLISGLMVIVSTFAAASIALLLSYSREIRQ